MKRLLFICLFLPLMAFGQQSWWGVSYEAAKSMPRYTEFYFTSGPPIILGYYGRFNQAIGIEYGQYLGKGRHSLSMSLSYWVHSHRYTYAHNWEEEVTSDIRFKRAYISLNPTYTRYVGKFYLAASPTINYAIWSKERPLGQEKYTPYQTPEASLFTLGANLEMGWEFCFHQRLSLLAGAFYHHHAFSGLQTNDFISNAGLNLTIRRK